MDTKKNEENLPLVDDNDPVPYFKIGAQPFASSTGMVMPEGVDGSNGIIPWAVPDGWKEEQRGPHHASRPPSLTWTPLNKAAKKLLDDHRAKSEAAQRGVSVEKSPMEQRLDRLERMLAASIEAQLAMADAKGIEQAAADAGDGKTKTKTSK